jgi:hypothetical protein
MITGTSVRVTDSVQRAMKHLEGRDFTPAPSAKAVGRKWGDKRRAATPTDAAAPAPAAKED